MRSDEQLDDSVRSAEAWNKDPVTGRRRAQVNRYDLPRLEKGRMSLSGHERNHLFLNQQGSSFTDISGISGVDSPKDSRSLAIWDYDRDGWQDIALVNTNSPVLNLFRNEIGSLSDDALVRGNVLALNFIGGNVTPRPSENYTARDGYGVQVTVTLPDMTLIREHRCGEGLAAQNSSTMLIGLGTHESVRSITVRWPAGTSQQIERVSAGDRITVFENPTASPDGSGFQKSRYLVETESPPVATPLAIDVANTDFVRPTPEPAELCMYTSMATWCVACRAHMPELWHLRNAFSADRMSMIGVPVDEKDTAGKLQKFISDQAPPYQLDGQWTVAQRNGFNQAIEDQLGTEVIPATVLATPEGRVMAIFAGVPTVSDIARLLEKRR